MANIQMILFLRVERLIEWRTHRLIAGSFKNKRNYKLGGPHIGFDAPGLSQFVAIDMNEPEQGFPEILPPSVEFDPVKDSITPNTTLHGLSAIVYGKCQKSLQQNQASYAKRVRGIVTRSLKALIGEIATPPGTPQIVSLRDDIGKYLPLSEQREQLHRGINVNLYKFLLSPYHKQDVDGTVSSIVERIVINAIAV